MKNVYLSLGSNVGDSRSYLLSAVEAIGRLQHTKVVNVSAVYRTEPVGKKDQPDFLNAAIEVTTTLTPYELVRQLKELERTLGRTTSERWGPREIDLDILYFGNLILHDTVLQIPHRELYGRRFALTCMNDLNSGFIDPQTLKPIHDLLLHCRDWSKVEKVDSTLHS